ncbi:MAG TPA: CoA ester lyase [Chloroflexi bacterium]|jgi:citrate lyase subunit beta/citryl-CoA lyase|nr:CoA ester lyase [Chloroflexota bacterium]
MKAVRPALLDRSRFRSLLLVPANDPVRADAGLAANPDALILDLEDGVSINDKESPRDVIASLVDGARHYSCAIYVRINGVATAQAFEDIATVVQHGLRGIVLPKAESAEDIAAADFAISHWERARGIGLGSVEILPIVETARGMLGAATVARASPRVRRLCFGSGDFTRDLGIVWMASHPMLVANRAHLVVISRASGIEAPIDTAYPRSEAEQGFVAEVHEARAMGFQGKICLLPEQVRLVNAVFTGPG